MLKFTNMYLLAFLNYSECMHVFVLSQIRTMVKTSNNSDLAEEEGTGYYRQWRIEKRLCVSFYVYKSCCYKLLLHYLIRLCL